MPSRAERLLGTAAAAAAAAALLYYKAKRRSEREAREVEAQLAAAPPAGCDAVASFEYVRRRWWRALPPLPRTRVVVKALRDASDATLDEHGAEFAAEFPPLAAGAEAVDVTDTETCAAKLGVERQDLFSSESRLEFTEDRSCRSW